MPRIRLLLPFWMNPGNLEALAAECGWPFIETRGPTELAEERIWATADGRAYISYLSDFGLRMNYLVVQGEGAEPVARDIALVFPVIGRDQVLALVPTAPGRDPWIQCLYQAAVVAREDSPDQDLVGLFVAGLGQPDPEVRRAAVYACTYAGWQELREPLERTAREDADADVRTMAEATLASLHQHVWGHG